MTKRGTVQQLQIMECLAKGMKRREIAATVGCHIQTVDKVRADPELKELFYKRCKTEIDELVPLAIKRLKTILENDKAQESVQVAAAREVMDRSYFKELASAAQSEIKLTVSYE